jgi:hypothetical protein
MPRRYMLCPSHSQEASLNWLEQMETWAQRAKRRIEWDIVKQSEGCTARIKSEYIKLCLHLRVAQTTHVNPSCT